MSNDAATLEVDTRYRNSALPIDERVEILLSQMTLAEKAGLFFQTMISMGPDGELGRERRGAPRRPVGGRARPGKAAVQRPPQHGGGRGITTGCALRHRVDTVDPLFRFGHGLTL